MSLFEMKKKSWLIKYKFNNSLVNMWKKFNDHNMNFNDYNMQIPMDIINIFEFDKNHKKLNFYRKIQFLKK